MSPKPSKDKFANSGGLITLWEEKKKQSEKARQAKDRLPLKKQDFKQY